MDADFWHQRWLENSIGFHENKTNSLLLSHFSELELTKNSRVFVPLCGKALDIAWLLSQGHRVVGIELSEAAIQQLFAELSITPTISITDKFKRYRAADLDILVGDFFDLTATQLGAVSAVYDRAALIALPEPMRNQYTQHLAEITAYAQQLLITFEYVQSHMSGPPFSVSSDELHRHYQARYTLDQLEQIDVSGGLKGRVAATENAWLLKPRRSSDPISNQA